MQTYIAYTSTQREAASQGQGSKIRRHWEGGGPTEVAGHVSDELNVDFGGYGIRKNCRSMGTSAMDLICHRPSHLLPLFCARAPTHPLSISKSTSAIKWNKASLLILRLGKLSVLFPRKLTEITNFMFTHAAFTWSQGNSRRETGGTSVRPTGHVPIAMFYWFQYIKWPLKLYPCVWFRIIIISIHTAIKSFSLYLTFIFSRK